MRITIAADPSGLALKDVIKEHLEKQGYIVTDKGTKTGGEVVFYLRNYGERIPLRGGRWTLGANAGMFTLNFGNIRDFRTDHFGFRAAFVEL